MVELPNKLAHFSLKMSYFPLEKTSLIMYAKAVGVSGDNPASMVA
jgi:hypothetical protein